MSATLDPLALTKAGPLHLSSWSLEPGVGEREKEPNMKRDLNAD